MSLRLLRMVVLRLVLMLPTLILIMLVGFLLLAFSPGDAVDAYLVQTGGDQAYAAQIRRALGLNRAPILRFIGYLGQAVQGNFGLSAIYNRPVMAIIAERLPNTLLLMTGALTVALSLGIGLGIISGLKPHSLRDRLATITSFMLFALPNFWAALLLSLLFALTWPILPVSGSATLAHFVLPSLALGLGFAALYARSLRAGMLAAWQHPMVRAAEARGIGRGALVWRNVMRPNAASMISIGAQNIGTLIGGSIVVETMFAIPGLGLLSYEAVSGRDQFLLVGLLVVVSVLVMLVQLAADLLIIALDPQHGGEADYD